MNETQQTDLHWLWDNDILMYHLHKHFASNVDQYFEYLYQLMINQSETIDTTGDYDYETWIQENIKIVCSKVYVDDNNQQFNTSFKLGQAYFERYWPLIDDRIILAGRRLSLLLKSLKPEEMKSSYHRLCLDSNTLISILCIELIVSAIIRTV